MCRATARFNVLSTSYKDGVEGGGEKEEMNNNKIHTVVVTYCLANDAFQTSNFFSQFSNNLNIFILEYSTNHSNNQNNVCHINYNLIQIFNVCPQNSISFAPPK